MSRVALVYPPDRDETVSLATEAASHLGALGHEVIDQPEVPVGPDVDVVVSIGGDGSILHAVRLACGAGVPVLGVHMGHLGYLNEVEPEAMRAALDACCEGRFRVEERLTLDVGVEAAAGRESGGAGAQSGGEGAQSGGEGGRTQHLIALNDVVVERAATGRTIRLVASINGNEFATYTADGIVVSTPTGSTAYNFSVRGPIVSPAVRALIVTPVSPHLLFDRALVLAPDEVLTLELQGTRRAVVMIDGAVEVPIETGGRLVCKVGDVSARLARLDGPHDFHAIVRAKFGLDRR